MYKNWPEGKKIPKSKMIYKDVWVIPKNLEAFMPPDELLGPCYCVVYTWDGMGYDLFAHKFVDA